MLSRKKSEIKFKARKHSNFGIIGTLIAVFTIILFGVLVFITTAINGTANLMIGLGGLILLLMAIGGLTISLSGMKQKDVIYTFPILGITLNGLMFIGMTIIYFFGLSI